MNYQNLFKIAIRAIAANKMRSFLTALGIIIGIAAVITMLAIPSDKEVKPASRQTSQRWDQT